MRGISNLLKEHDEAIGKAEFDSGFLAYHMTQIKFLQHERLVHLLVMLFVLLCSLVFLVLFFVTNISLFLVVFVLLIVLGFFYILHYYKLENTVIKWYFVYNDNLDSQEAEKERRLN